LKKGVKFTPTAESLVIFLWQIFASISFSVNRKVFLKSDRLSPMDRYNIGSSKQKYRRVMHTVYRLNASELDQRFINALKATFPDKEIEIVVYEVDETSYLTASVANRKRLIRAIENVKSGSNLIAVNLENLE